MKSPIARAVAIGIVVFLMLCAAVLAGAQTDSPLSVTVNLEPASATIGQRICYILRVSCDKDIEVRFPDTLGKLGDFTVRDTRVSNRVFFGRRKAQARYTIDTFTTGEAAIAKLPVEYKARGDAQWRSYDIPERKVMIVSVLEKAGAAAAVRDIKGPLGLSPQLRVYFVLAALVFVCAVIAALAMRAGRRKAGRPAVPPVPAHSIAYRQLEELKAKNLVEQGKIKEFFIELSGIVRYYLENRFKLKAPEMTTEEFLESAGNSADLGGEHRGLLKEFLVRCDLVKFARYAPQAQEIEEAFLAARRFVDQTREP